MSGKQDFLGQLNVEKDDFWHRNKDRVLLPYIKGEKILDLGCGLGSLSIALAKQGKDITAVDDEEHYLRAAKRKSKGLKIKYIHMDFTKEDLKVKNKFDTIIISGVIEHIKDDHSFLKKIHTLLKEGGQLVILTSAYPRLYSAFDRSVGHYRRYSKKGLKKVVEESEFKVKKVKYWDMLALPILFLTKVSNKIIIKPEGLTNKNLDSVLNWWFLVFENRMWLPFGADLIVVAEK